MAIELQRKQVDVDLSDFGASEDGHGDAGEYESHSYALQVADSSADAGEFASNRHENAVIDGDHDDHEQDWDDWEGCWWDVERFGEAGVHCVALLDGEEFPWAWRKVWFINFCGGFDSDGCFVQEPGEKEIYQENRNGGEAETPIPPFVVLNPHEERQADGAAEANREQEIVEEGGHLGRFFGIILVELVRTVRGQRSLDSRAPEGQEKLEASREDNGFESPEPGIGNDGDQDGEDIASAEVVGEHVGRIR
ncbi:Protein NRT1/ PTR FAMILY 4.5 [Senna tora]|uniref:Protein NRT1/ PTR FAMILY 4.5 n=1 Tax=Senna tora TaxID=362788 RepID=A0A834VYX2_9FABA|nr:Protein NRT1/ PTR FAMILY 4.5 [Senna tora]